MLSNHKGPGLICPYFHLDPCVCSTFSSQGQKFTDYAQPNVTGAVTTDYMNVTRDSSGNDGEWGGLADTVKDGRYAGKESVVGLRKMAKMRRVK